MVCLDLHFSKFTPAATRRTAAWGRSECRETSYEAAATAQAKTVLA